MNETSPFKSTLLVESQAKKIIRFAYIGIIKTHHYFLQALQSSTCEKAWNSKAADNLEVETVRQENRQVQMKMNLSNDLKVKATEGKKKFLATGKHTCTSKTNILVQPNIAFRRQKGNDIE